MAASLDSMLAQQLEGIKGQALQALQAHNAHNAILRPPGMPSFGPPPQPGAGPLLPTGPPGAGAGGSPPPPPQAQLQQSPAPQQPQSVGGGCAGQQPALPAGLGSAQTGPCGDAATGAQPPTVQAPNASTAPPQGAQSSTLSVAVDECMCVYELSEEDLRETFQRWGPLQSVQVHKEGSREVGVVTFADAVDASDAQKQLNGYSCDFDGKTGKLVVVFGNPEQLSSRAAGGDSGNGGSCGTGAGPEQPVPPAGPVANGAPRPAGWACKIIVQADSMHHEFALVHHIVGAGNANVEHIQSQCGCSVRLRGLKSGQKEPDTGKELQEQMAIWLSAEGPQAGQPALEMCQDLLKSVYEEHDKFLQQKGLKPLGMSPPPVVLIPPELAAGPPLLNGPPPSTASPSGANLSSAPVGQATGPSTGTVPQPGTAPAPAAGPQPGAGPPLGAGPSPGAGPPPGAGPMPGAGPLSGTGPPPGAGPTPGAAQFAAATGPLMMAPGQGAMLGSPMGAPCGGPCHTIGGPPGPFGPADQYGPSKGQFLAGKGTGMPPAVRPY